MKKEEESSKRNTTNYFNVEDPEDVVKVEKCTFANDDIESKNFYVCPCYGDEFFPICEACAHSCHKNHRPAQLINENFTCKCGEKEHIHKEARSNEIFGCIYTKCHEFTQHKGFFKVGSRILCSVCMHRCISKDEAAAQPDSQLPKGIVNTCECTSHTDVNVTNINADFADLSIFDHFQCFNFNIIEKIPNIKKMFLGVVITKLQEYKNLFFNSDEESLKNHDSSLYSKKVDFRLEFFKNIKILKIFELFSKMKNMHNPFFVLKKDIFNLEYTKDLLINLISFEKTSSKKNIDNVKDASNYSYSKIYYAEFIFNYLIKRKISDKLLRINGPTYSNLNILQRYLYLHKPYEFCKNTKNHYKDEAFHEEYINLFVHNLLNLYESILKLHELFSIDQLKQIVFLKFNKIFKDLIKYNLIEDGDRKKYFELVKESVSKSSADLMDSKKDINDVSINKENPYYIIKSLFFSLMYLNDKLVLQKFSQKEFDEKEDLNFAFNSNKDSYLYNYIFSNVINSFERNIKKKDPIALKKFLKYDFYVKKIFELMICTNENNFYIKSLENLKHYPSSLIKKKFLSKGINDLFFEQIKISKDKNQIQAYEAVDNFAIKINLVCNSFQEFSIDFSKFTQESNEIFDQLSIYLHNNFNKNLSKVVLNWSNIIHEKFNDIETNQYYEKIKCIQEAVQLSTFYSALNKFFFIYGSDKKFKLNLSQNKMINDEIKKEHLQMILNFLYLAMKDNNSNLTLLFSFHPSRFSLAFSEIETEFLIFLSYISEILFSDTNNSHKFDNYIFYLRVVQSICNRLKFDAVDHDKISTNILILGYLLKSTKKAVRFVSFFNNEIIELIDSINLTILEIKKKHQNYFMDYFKEDIFKRWPKNLQTNLTFCINHYFGFIIECQNTGILYINNIYDNNLIYKKEDIDSILQHGYFDNLFVKQKMLVNYAGLFFNFNFKNSKSDTDCMTRLLYATYGNSRDKLFHFKDRNISPIHLTDFETALNPGEIILDKNTKYFKHLDELNEIKTPFMKKLIDDFPIFIEDCNKILSKYNKKKIFKIYKYYTYLIFNPLFTIINHYLLIESEIRGQESYKIYDLVINFLQVTIKMYEFPLIKELENKGYREQMDKEGLYIVDKLSDSKIDSMYKDLESLTNKIDYFEIIKIIDIYKKNIANILTKNYTENNGDTKTSSSNIYSVEYSKKLNKNQVKRNEKSQKHLNSDENEKKFEFVVSLYKLSFSKGPSKSLSLVEVIANNNNEFGDLNLELQIFNYLNKKLCDSLSYNNVNSLTEYKEKHINDIFTSESKKTIHLQNFYVIDILNYMFLHDSKSFQTQVASNVQNYKESFTNFLKHIFKSSIFLNLVNEVKMMYQLDLFAYQNKRTRDIENNLSYEMALKSIELIFHLIENRNRTMQNILYEMMIDSFESIIIENDQNFVNASEKSYKEKVIEKTLREQQFANFTEEDKNKERENMMKRSSIINMDQEQTKVIHLKEFDGLEKQKFNCLSFIFLQMKLLIKNIPLNENNLVFFNRELKSYKKLLNIYNSFSNLLIHMVQGIKSKNLDLFYKKISGFTIEEYYNENSEYFYFLKYAKDIKELIMSENIVDLFTLPIKCFIFKLLNSLISQDLQDKDSLVVFCSNFIDLKELLNICSQYLKAVYIKNRFNMDYTSKEFVHKYATFEFDKDSFKDLKDRFNNKPSFSDDDFFKHASQIFLFISILSQKYNVPSAKNIINLFDPDSFEILENEDKKNEENNEEMTKKRKNKIAGRNENAKNEITNFPQENSSSVLNKETLNKNDVNKFPLYKLMVLFREIKVKEKTKYNLIATKLFYMNILKTCEFVIDSANDEKMEEKVKTVFFIIDAKTLLIPYDSYEIFFKDVDRSGPNSKLMGLLDQLPIFELEIKHKLKLLEAGNLKSFNVDYKNVEFVSFLISVIIVVYLFFFLTAANVNNYYIYYPIFVLAGTQMSINLYYLYIFSKNKLDYYISLNILQLNKKKLTWLQNKKLIVIDSFLLNDEIYILWLNVLVAVVSFYSSKWTFLFTVQLLGVVRFVETIKQIFFAFRLRFAQFISMIGFLAILINLYAMFGFLYEVNQFKIEVETDEGTVEKNMCDTLISCYILYFNYGVKSGGGVGDLLEYRFMKDDAYYYWIRYLADFLFYFTIIVLLLNMINGIIISTFANLRKDNEEKTDDIKNKCFMCSISRVEFEKRKIDFKDHSTKTHYYINYILYLISLKLNNDSQVDFDQQYILKHIMERRIKFFPIKTTACINNEKIESDLEE